MIVLKFGGSSVKNAERIEQLCGLVKPRVQRGEDLAIVVSALGGATDTLIGLAEEATSSDPSYLAGLEALHERHVQVARDLLGQESEGTLAMLEVIFQELEGVLKGIHLLKEASPRTMDLVQSFGERCSAFIIAQYLHAQGLKATFADARQLIRTDEAFGQAKVNPEITGEQIRAHFEQEQGILHVVTGFIGSTAEGVTTTLGRGGSDYTAAVFAASLRAEVLEIWTDVDGVLTADPRVVKDARSIERLSYAEAMELSHFGAKVIYPPTIQPALAKDIPILIKNTYRPEHPGTHIGKEKVVHPASGMTGLSSIRNISLLTIEGTGLVGVPGTSARFFGALGRAGVNVIMITQASSEHSICIAIGEVQLDTAKMALELEFAQEMERGSIKSLRTESALSIIAMVGEGMRHRTGVAGRLFSALGRNGINIVAVAQGASEMNVTFVVEAKNESKALGLVHDAFFTDQKNKLHVFLVGVGLIGSTLLEQIKSQHATLMQENRVDIRICGLANSRKMLCSSEGIELTDWKETLEKDGQESSFEGMLECMKSLNLPNSVLVDCTANPEIKMIYPDTLKQSISIATANKVAASSSQAEYDELISLSKRYGAPFMNETNVGAGLPVIANLRHLVESGDKVRRIEAVISGSLSYIFNHFDGTRSFEDLVKEARAKGFTEPDPREDLSGNDIKRKIVILARVAGFQLEPEEVEVESLLPNESMEAPSIDAFFVGLGDASQALENKVEQAEASGQRLRYIASFANGKAKVELQSIGEESPFFNLASTDNMILVYSDRYAERPLVVAGPGAGAEVTAAGVFAELIQTAARIDA